MKKIILVFTAIAITGCVYAQSDSSQNKMNHDMSNMKTGQTNKSANGMSHMDMSHSDGVMMQNGKMMVMKDGKMTVMSEAVTLNDGTKIMSDGTIIKKDGTKTMMQEGQHYDMSGKMVPMKSNKDKMYLVPDSTLNRKSK